MFPARGRPKSQQPSEPPRRFALSEALVSTGVGLALLLPSLAVDPWTPRNAFGPVKALGAELGLGIAAFGALLMRTTRGDRPLLAWPRPKAARVSLAAFLALAGWAGLSATLSPRRPLAFDSLRQMALFALALAVGASRSFSKKERLWLAILLAAASIYAPLALLDRLHLFRPFALIPSAERLVGAGLAGNPGHAALLLGLAVPACLAVAVLPGVPRLRWIAAALVALFAAGIAATENLSGALSASAGCLAVLLWRYRTRSLIPLLLGAGIAASAFFLTPPLRRRAGDVVRAIQDGDWNKALSYRSGPWLAAAEMIRERPLTGFGPGTFGSEYVPHRLAAEIHHHRRYLSGFFRASFGEAHNEYLQLPAELGLPALPLALASVGALAGSCKRPEPQAGVLAGLLGSGAVAATTWFPFQIAITAVPLLLGLGRLWALTAEGP